MKAYNDKEKEYNFYYNIHYGLLNEEDDLNGNWISPGKENNAQINSIIFEGEFINGKRYRGKIKDYNSNGKILKIMS